MRTEITKITEAIENLVAGAQSKPAVENGLEYVIIRGKYSGATAGFLKSQEGSEVILLQARKLWYWSGAASLYELADRGVSKPENCKFPKIISEVKILDCVEVIKVSESGRKSIEGVKIWTA